MLLRYHLYFLFDLMPGGDLMDVLVAEASVIKKRVPQGGWQVGCLAPKVKMLQVRCCTPAPSLPAMKHGLSSSSR